MFFASQIHFDEASKNHPNYKFGCSLYLFGGKDYDAIFDRHQYFRLYTSIHLHTSYLHFFINMYTYMFYGFSLEKIYGTKKIAILAFLNGLTGNLMSCLLYPSTFSVASSNPTFGLIFLQCTFTNLIQSRIFTKKR